MRKFGVLVSSLVLILAIFVSSRSLTVDARSHGPIIKNKNGSSLNWAGYAAYNGTSSDVKGTWVVPSVSCTNTSTYSSSWVGLDGYNDSSVEQTGTEHDCINGSPSYYAWYEMYPKPGYIAPIAVNAGDTMTAEVKFTGRGNFALTITNVTKGTSFTTNQRMNKAQRLSAEWITEAPWSGGVLPLANFGTMNFSNALVDGQTIQGSPLTKDQINMVASDGTTLKAQTSSLDGTGAGFSVTWKSN